MINFSAAIEQLTAIREITPDSQVELEEDAADGYLILRVPCSFGFRKTANGFESVPYYGHEVEL